MWTEPNSKSCVRGMIFVDFLEKRKTGSNDEPKGAGFDFEMDRNLDTKDEESEKLEPFWQ